MLGVVLLAGVAWGWNAATKPLPERADLPVCEVTTVAKGDKIYADQVTISVLNAGSREGLAGRTMQLFVEQGFAVGASANASADTRVPTVELWTDDPGNPAVKLVASRLPEGARVVRRDTTTPGITVVVGDEFTDLVKGKRAVRAREDAEVCSPPVGP